MNSVPSNGGDEAILIATILGIQSKLPYTVFNVLCNNALSVQQHIDYIDIDLSWEDTLKQKEGFINRIKAAIRRRLNRIGIYYSSNLSQLFSDRDEKRIVNLIKDADYIISAGGGYIHDLYGYEMKIQTWSIALKNKKKLIFLGHSMGPFFNPKQNNRLKRILKKSSSIILREKYSQYHLNNIGYGEANISITTDIAFTLYNHYKELFIKEKKEKKIVISFREWTFSSTNEFIINQAAAITSFLIKKGYEITFLSTCQGLSSYLNDSEIGIEIGKKLSEQEKKSYIVDEKKYSVTELIKRYSEYHAYIGMRLHSSILSMLGGTPAFSLSYEDKAKGIFEFCGLEDYCIDFDTDINIIIPLINNFIENSHKIKLKEIVERASKCATKNFDIFE